ncbi:hypothetical protein MKEN_00468400 [Mycena kentingensis (nom. inval.)]|nr:hypothetical protein MKEN_00468400 [Mycena kentingensis (nom. inval.)]
MPRPWLQPAIALTPAPLAQQEVDEEILRRAVSLVPTATPGISASNQLTTTSHSHGPQPTRKFKSDKQAKTPVGVIWGVSVGIVVGIMGLFLVRLLFIRRAKRRAVAAKNGGLQAEKGKGSFESGKGGGGDAAAAVEAQAPTLAYATPSPPRVPPPVQTRRSSRQHAADVELQRVRSPTTTAPAAATSLPSASALKATSTPPAPSLGDPPSLGATPSESLGAALLSSAILPPKTKRASGEGTTGHRKSTSKHDATDGARRR